MSTISISSAPFSQTKFSQFSPSLKPISFKSLATKKALEFRVMSSISVDNSSFFMTPKRGGSGSGGGSGLLERPTFDRSQFDGPIPEAEQGGDIGKMKQRIGTRGGGSYRVLMIDDVRHSETFVAKFLPKAVPAVTSADARNIFHKSRILGAAVVLVTVKEHAEFYAHMMLRGGLKSAIEPDSDTA